MTTDRDKESPWHIPVMLKETLELLDPAPGKVIVDATLGGGGHAAAILDKLQPGGKLIGLDRDEEALREAGARLAPYKDAFLPVKANFRELHSVLERCGVVAVDGILFDLGVSSHQLDSPQRGFAYRRDELLDMRMDIEQEQTAGDLLNRLNHRELAAIFRRYGEEKWAGRIASFIVAQRRKRPITHSGQLVEIIREAIPVAVRRKGGHPAKRVFQALRIAVNDELENLQGGLQQGIDALGPGGRITVIAYHSLEDRLVKEAFHRFSRGCTCPPGLPLCRCEAVTVLKLLTKKPLLPGREETGINPRAKSARLRAAEKLQTPTKF
ncbi:MAG: 16S rRNA (cytosine(1402)-N(4))-methyltransferase RsmH [Bacillota bacterium]